MAGLLHSRVDSSVRATMMSVESLALQAGGAVASITVGALAAAFGLIGGSVSWQPRAGRSPDSCSRPGFIASPAVVIHQARWVAPARMAIGVISLPAEPSQRSRRAPKGVSVPNQPAAQSPSACAV